VAKFQQAFHYLNTVDKFFAQISVSLFEELIH
jgi:hypothetical protein